MKNKTRAEKEHLNLIGSMPCIVCGAHGVQVHHLPRLGGRKNHFHTIPLCFTHHTGGNIGTAVHSGRRSFERNFGTEAELLEKVNRSVSCHRGFMESQNQDSKTRGQAD